MAIQAWLKPQLWGYQRTTDAYNYNDSGPKEDGAGKNIVPGEISLFPLIHQEKIPKLYRRKMSLCKEE